MTRIARSALPVAVLLVLTGLVALAFGRIYEGDQQLYLLLGAAAASILLGAALRPLPNWTVAPVSMLLLFGYTVLAVKLTVHAETDTTLAATYVDAARNALPRLLTAAVPIEPSPDTVLAPIVVLWLAGMVGTELAARGGRLLFGILPPTLAYGAALVLAGPAARPELWQSLVYATVCVLGLALTARRAETAEPAVPVATRVTVDDRAVRLRALGGASAGLAALLAVAVVGGFMVFDQADGKAPSDPRTEVTPPRKDVLDENPLSRISGWAAAPQQRLLDATLSADGNIRLGVLSEYDGVTWKVGADYRNVSRILPSPAGPAPIGKQTELKQSYTVAELGGGLVPAVGTARQIDGLRVAFDTVTGTLYRSEGLKPGQKYTVDSVITAPDVNKLSIVNVPSGPAVERYLSIGTTKVPQEMLDMAKFVSEQNSTPDAKARGLAEFLGEHFTYDAAAPSGHAFPNLRFFLNEKPELGGRKGTSEQFAAAYAVLGRMMGLPTRVVVGFKGKAGTHPVLAQAAQAWPEVLFEGVGWVSYDPMPKDPTAKPLEKDYTPPPPKPTPSVSPSTVKPTPLLSTGPPKVADQKQEVAATPLWQVLLAVGGGVLGVLLLAVGVILLLRRARRTGRMDSGAPPERVLGAWLELRDGLRLAGHRVPKWMTASEIGAHAETVLVKGRHSGGVQAGPRPTVAGLATVVNLVGFAPGLVSDADARLAAQEATAYLRALRAGRAWWWRALWSVSPLPLLWGPSRPVVVAPSGVHQNV